jgi:SAM-dependent methyltransferase
MEVEARKQREADFHDHAFADERRSELWGTWYRLRGASDFYERYLERECAGRDILEYGCGKGSQAFFVAEHGARSVTGIDISPVGIQKAADQARARGLDGISFQVMDAENLEFEDDGFDLVCGRAILHHLDLERSYSQLARVLRQGGRAVFVEPLGHNPLINRFRNRTPDLRTVDEHPLLMDDLRLADAWFGTVRARFYYLTALGAVALVKTPLFEPAVATLEAVDRLAFRLLPPVRPLAWQIVLELGEPRKSRAPVA